ncbi:MAG TPA: hypothetical protein VKR06_12690 [Ktedonosporobacter sp.]|nr:hypothetical protein [Ktedonosporobacter sp.]
MRNKHIYFKNVELDYFLQYTLACQTYQGSAYGECFFAASQVHEEDLEMGTSMDSRSAKGRVIWEKGRGFGASGQRQGDRSACSDLLCGGTDRHEPSECAIQAGADAHNQANNLSLLHEIVFDWLDEVYNEG